MMLCKGRLKTGIRVFRRPLPLLNLKLIRTQDDGTGGLAGLFDGQD